MRFDFRQDRDLPLRAAAALCAALVSGALAGCATEPAPPPPVVAEPLQASDFRLPITLDARVTDPAEREVGQGYIDETRRVIESPAFAANLARLSDEMGGIMPSPYGRKMRSERVAAVYLGQVPEHRAFASTLLWVDGGDAAADYVGATNSVLIKIGREKRDQWTSGEVVARSCAINTLAHELAHTIPESQDGFRYLFTDAGRRWATFWKLPLASYVIGSVAQCTYLDEHRQMTHGSLKACVNEWGKNQFRSGGCR